MKKTYQSPFVIFDALIFADVLSNSPIRDEDNLGFILDDEWGGLIR